MKKGTLKIYRNSGYVTVPPKQKLPSLEDVQKLRVNKDDPAGETLLPPGVERVGKVKEQHERLKQQEKEIELLLPPGVKKPCLDCD